MRENRTYGSEGGAADWPSLPYKESSHEDTKTPGKAVLIELVSSSLLLFVPSCLSGKLPNTIVIIRH